jgi:hypothetical protein
MGKEISINTFKGISCYVCLGACIVPKRVRERERGPYKRMKNKFWIQLHKAHNGAIRMLKDEYPWVRKLASIPSREFHAMFV